MNIQKKTKCKMCCQHGNTLKAVFPYICILLLLAVIFVPVMSDGEEPTQEQEHISGESKIGSMTREQYRRELERQLRLREKEKRKEEKRRRRGRL